MALSVRNKKLLLFLLPALVVLIADQISKYAIRTNPGLHRVNLIDGWLAFNYTKNPGMAMGMDWLSTPTISVIAIIATIGITIYVIKTLPKANYAYMLCMGLILGGAIGNISDRIFMAVLMGYGGVLDGHVVDFIHFNLQIGDWPVFPYIFNVADVAISTSIIAMLLFHKRILPDPDAPDGDPENLSDAATAEGSGDELTEEAASKTVQQDTAPSKE
ncbi:MAG: signal peptidase II [Balneolaceae bacterium]